ncbi:MAG: DUF2213 domain-containing protein, partial [Planctomycetota bacterium]|nr:DUF2213 domain-containing protein [Planctomycetota bacterium]
PYHRADGSVYRELRLPSEVFREDSLGSMRYAPVTDLHGGMVDPSNVGDLQVGIVGQDVDHDGAFVVGSAIIQRKDMIDAVKSKARSELSPGYRCWVQDEGGRWDGSEFGLGKQDYDGVQRDITYNHLAIGPKDWGRSGPDVALRMDGLGEGAAYAGHTEIARSPMIQVPADIKPRGHIDMKKITIVLDGASFEIEVPEALAGSFAERFANLQSKAEKVDGLEGKLAAAEKATKDVQDKLDTATDPKAIQAAIAARTELVADVKRIAPKLEIDEKLDDKGLKVAALVEAGTDAAVFEDRTDGYIDGMFEHAVSAAPEGDDDGDVTGHPVVKPRRAVAGPAPTTRTDGDDTPVDETVEGTTAHTDAAREAMLKRNREMSQGKLDAARPGVYDA